MPARGFFGGETGIRTLGSSFHHYNGLANRRLKPLGHLSRQLPSRVYTTEGKCKSLLYAKLNRILKSRKLKQKAKAKPLACP
jgi:transposase